MKSNLNSRETEVEALKAAAMSGSSSMFMSFFSLTSSLRSSIFSLTQSVNTSPSTEATILHIQVLEILWSSCLSGRYLCISLGYPLQNA